eukprot:1990601-Alexandrium_andersonii.AAC.1
MGRDPRAAGDLSLAGHPKRLLQGDVLKHLCGSSVALAQKASSEAFSPATFCGSSQESRKEASGVPGYPRNPPSRSCAPSCSPAAG